MTERPGQPAKALMKRWPQAPKPIDWARANAFAACDCAREVAEAKGPSEFIQAWTTHATKQFDVLTKQAGELTTLGQRFANTTVESSRRAGQASKR